MIKLVALIAVLTPFALGSSKKGFGLCGAKYRCGDTYALSTSSWWYNWHPTPEENKNFGCSRGTRGEFVPMVHGEYDVNSFYPPSNSKYVLGFNEPNVLRNGHFELEPERAAQLWPKIEERSHGRTMVSPAPTSCDSWPGSCYNWFDRFFKACHNCRVDKLALHSYSCDVNKIMNMIDTFYHRYNRKIWLTEFACDWAKNADDNINFLKKILPRLESSPYVERYAWFCTREKPDYSHVNWNLLNQDSPTLSKVGQYYNSNYN